MSNIKNVKEGIKLNKEFNLSEDFEIPSYNEWKSSAENLLKGQAFEKKLITKTYEGIDLDPIYLRKDLETIPNIDSEPGKDNYLRGTNAGGYIEKNWEICQDIKADSLDGINTKLKRALKRGQTSILLDIDILKIKNQEAFSQVISEIDLNKYPIYIKTRLPFNTVLNFIFDHSEKNGFDPEKIAGVIEADPITYLAEFGNFSDTVDNIHKDMERSLRSVVEKLPKLRLLGINGNLFCNAGADSVTELAASMAIAVEYLSEMSDRGIDVNDLAKQISFTVGIGTNFFMEICKLRALRVLWQKIIKEFGGDIDAQKTFIHAKTSNYYQTKLDPFVNTLRTTTGAFSAILGGADVITTGTYDDVSGTQTDLSKRIARNTQIILKEESNLKRLIDPAGGSYYIESLTEKIIKKVWGEFQNIEKNGGIIESLKSGIIQDKIDSIVSLRKKDIYKRKSVIVGTNMFVNTEDKVPGIKTKKDLETADGETLIRKLEFSRLAEPFEDMRKMVSDFTDKTKTKPKVFLANFGAVKQYKGRADFSRGYFEVGGFEVIYPDGFTDIETMVSDAAGSDAGIVVVCSDDKTYPEIIDKFSRSLKNKKKEALIVLAGFPGKLEEEYRASGVDDFIYMGSNLYTILESLLKKTGVK